METHVLLCLDVTSQGIGLRGRSEKRSSALHSVLQEVVHQSLFKVLVSPVQLFVTSWTVAHQAPLSRDSPGKNIGFGSHSFLRGIFLT